MKYIFSVFLAIFCSYAIAYDEQKCKSVHDGDWPKFRECVNEFHEHIQKEIDSLVVSIIEKHPNSKDAIISDKNLMISRAHLECSESMGGMGITYLRVCMNRNMTSIFNKLRSKQY